MTDLAVRVEGLGKRYRLGRPAGYHTLRDRLAELARRSGRPAAAGPGAGEPAHLWALRDVSLEVKQGEAVGIIGRNGAGKSTLLKILSRITEPTEGAVDLHGRVSSLLEVGTGFHPELTGRENIFLNGAILGMPRTEIRRKFDEIVAFAEVEPFLDTPVKHYSSGMYLRLAFAVAAHLEPDILLVDEVLAVGDAAFQKKCLGKMGDVAREGRTVLFVSHNLPAMKRFCGTAYLLERGRVVCGGPTAEVVDAYYRSAMGEDGLAERREVPPGSVRFAAWQVADGSAGPHGCVTGAACSLRFELIARRRLEAANFGLALWSADGTLVFAMRSLDRGGECVPLPDGRYEVEFSIPSLPLAPGSYEILVSANDLREGTLDAWYARPPLRILPRDERGLPPQWQGVLEVPGQFHLRPAPGGTT